jgi:hypothetical protein
MPIQGPPRFAAVTPTDRPTSRYIEYQPGSQTSGPHLDDEAPSHTLTTRSTALTQKEVKTTHTRDHPPPRYSSSSPPPYVHQISDEEKLLLHSQSYAYDLDLENLILLHSTTTDDAHHDDSGYTADDDHAKTKKIDWVIVILVILNAIVWSLVFALYVADMGCAGEGEWQITDRVWI